MDINLFFIEYLLAIAVTRIFLAIWPIHGRKIGNFQPHHYMHGLILIALYFLWPQTILLAIGIAWVVDEIPLFFIFRGWDWPDNHWKQYHSKQSVMAIVIISVLGYVIFRLLTN